MKGSITVALIAALLQGCAGSPINIANMSQAEMAQQDDITLCYAYGHMKSANIREELLTRKSIRNWDLIDNKRIKIGMTNAEILCSWGAPMRTYKSVGSYGVHKQYIYGTRVTCGRYGCIGGVSHYVYIENGKVTGWSK